MSTRKILLTSFRPWLEHQQSNSSDDLLALVQDLDFPKVELIFLRQLIVDTKLASKKVIAAIAQHQPDIILCCGMAESRQILTLESQASYKEKHFQTQLNLEKFCGNLRQATVSNDAGKFVCEGLYFHVLEYLQKKQLSTQVTFVHIPSLTATNKDIIFKDFQKIIECLGWNLEDYLN
ncbi:pyrrolidone-carboxylate peptidase [[Leptolyngbya] sp. PCC 7376]|uniref:pyroglutamyl-peptidase I family protein n=1 Tax=[Leptolyngbya] sp. PCC 7376 TaxID=111781 RepID=UPI00029EE525|nr:pyrrolidone-carboxylate peptidase [[Leptolyngbya] sp. PCC 7376]AFY39795.1 pyrrolidone-carboxylate peptidase [[Leptolyngbya] sp. PCC 7376]